MSDSTPEITVYELATALAQGATVVDVRETSEYVDGHVPGAVLMPMGQLPGRVHELDQGRGQQALREKTSPVGVGRVALLERADDDGLHITDGHSNSCRGRCGDPNTPIAPGQLAWRGYSIRAGVRRIRISPWRMETSAWPWLRSIS